MAIFRNQAMPMQPPGGISSLLSRLRRPMTPPMGGFGGFGGGGFGPPPFNPMMMRGGFPGMGGGFFGGFRPRFKRRPRPQMPDYSGQISGLEAKIAELQEQLAARQAATPMPDPVMDVAGPRIGTMGGPGFGEFPLGTAGPRIDPSDPAFVPPPAGGIGPGNIQIPNISDGRLDALDIADIQERIANLNIDVGGEGGRPDMPVSMPVVPKGRPVVSLPPQDVGGRKKLTKGPGMPKKIPMKPPSIERIMPPLPEEIAAPTTPQTGFFGKIQEAIEARRDPRGDFIPFVPPQINEPMPMPIRIPEPMPTPAPVMPAPVMPAPVMPAPVMPKKIPMPSLPKFPMPQIDPMGRVAAPLTRGPVNAAINMPAVGMRGMGRRMM